MATISGTRCFQDGSLLFRLPQELRDVIYRFVFSSTSISYFSVAIIGAPNRSPRVRAVTRGGLPKNLGEQRRFKVNILALLRTCHRINEEIGDWWITLVRFDFHLLNTMLAVLGALPIAKRSMMRHVILHEARETELNSRLFPKDVRHLHNLHQRYIISYKLSALFKLLPGLRLDVLELWFGIDTHATLSSFIDLMAEGDGWRELRFFDCYSAPLMPQKDYGRSTLPLIQPQAWRERLIERDGEASNPSIALFRSTLPDSGDYWKSPVFNPATRTRYVHNPRGLEPEVLAESLRNFFLAAGGKEESHKGLLFVARRGAGVDYTVKLDSPFVSGNDLRRDLPGKTWTEISKCQSRWYWTSQYKLG